MSTTRPVYSKEEFARRGDELYAQQVRAKVESAHLDEFVAIDIETGSYEVDASEMGAADRLRARLPNAQVWLTRIGSRHVRHFGPRRP